MTADSKAETSALTLVGGIRWKIGKWNLESGVRPGDCFNVVAELNSRGCVDTVRWARCLECRNHKGIFLFYQNIVFSDFKVFFRSF